MTANISKNQTKPIRERGVRHITAEVSIRHLHLNPTVTDQIETLGCKTLTDIVGVLTNPELSAENRQELATQSFSLMGCISGHNVDWLSYYGQPGFEPKGLYFHCSEFRDIDTNNPVFAINSNSFGNAGAMLERVGYATFGLLLDHLRTGISKFPPEFGSKKLREFWSALIDLANATREKPEILEEWALRYPLGSTSASKTKIQETTVSTKSANPAPELSPQIRALDLGVLHLGKKTDMIRNQGLMTIGDIAAYPPWKLLSLPSMGRKTVNCIDEALLALGRAQLPNGDTDWETYCELMQLTLLPPQRLEGSFSETIALLSIVIGETILSGETEDNRIILENRIMKPPSERLTLEALGDLMPTKITRERVRQKEAMILKRLADSLIYGDYAMAPYHFRPEFTDPWRRAAEHFSNSESDMSLSEMVSGLETAWGIPSEAFQDQMPLITAIITGELASGVEFRKAMPNETGRLSQGSGAALYVPLKHLQIKKAASALAEVGIQNVGEFLDAAASGVVSIERSGPARTARQHVEFLAQSVDQDGNVDWRNYAWLADVPVVPERDNLKPEEFLAEIIPTAAAALEARQLSVIATDTFRLRTTLPLQTRPTADAMAEYFGNHGPTVKRVETKLLEFLNEVFLEQHLSIARAHIGSEFLAYWNEIDRAFDETEGDTDLVKRVLAGNWSMTTDGLEPYMPAIVAIMTGYPMGRLGRYTKIQNYKNLTPKEHRKREHPLAKQLKEFIPQRVVLRGFRRTH